MTSLRSTLIAPIAYAVAAILCAGLAAAAEWRIEKMSGDVRIFQDSNITWVSLSPNRTIRPGDSIWTGHNGRVLLASGEGKVFLNPRSLIKVPAQYLPENQTVLFQSMGTVEAEVTKREDRHFSIQSPYLAAVVKGTKFTLEIDNGHTRLGVSEGVVEATDTETGQVVAVAAGEFVTKVNGAASGLSGNAPGANPSASDGSPPGAGSSGGDSAGNGGGGSDNEFFGNNGNNRSNGKGKKLGHFR
jgi:hypothetical protein